MASYQETTFDSIDRPKPQAIRDRAFTLSLKVFTKGVLEDANLGSPTISVTLPAGGELPTAVEDDAVAKTAGLLTFSLIAGNTGELDANYRAVWKVPITGANPAILEFVTFFDVVRTPLWNTVKQADLLKYHPDLANLLFTGEADYQDTIELAFTDVFEMLETKGFRPYLVLDAMSLHKPTAHRALWYLFMARAKNGEDRFSFWADHHLGEFNKWFASTTFIYDSDNDGVASTSETDATAGEEGSGGSPRIII